MARFAYFSSLRFRICAAFALLIGACAAALGITVYRSCYRDLAGFHEQAGLILARNLAQSLGDAVAAGDEAATASLLARLRVEPFARYAAAFDGKGRLLGLWFDRAHEVPQTELTRGAGFLPTFREFAQNGMPLMQVDLPIRVPEPQGTAATALVGTLRVGLSQQMILERAATVRGQTVRIAALVALLGALASIFLVRRFLAPVSHLIAATRLIEDGDFDAVVAPLPAAGELQELGAAMNRMTRALRSMKRQLLEANLQLERKVEERTAELSQALEELKSLDLLKDEFLSSVSHEFRTPLTSIRAYAEILLKFHDEDPATRAEFLDIIIQESERLARLVNDILDLVKIEAGNLDWRLQEIDVLEVAETALRNLRPLLDEHRLRATVARRGVVPRVRADGDRLFQVFTNLLSNAIKFSHDGGGIEVEARALRDTVEVVVVDHGIGIDPQDQTIIFDRFRQVGDTLTDKPRGTGLGLPICRNIVLRHGGRIWVESRPNQGSSFHFTLPVLGPAEDDLRRSFAEPVGRVKAETSTQIILPAAP